MPKVKLLLLALTVTLLTGYFTLVFNTNFTNPVSKNEMETAINQAQHLYRQRKEQGGDFLSGPCLSNALMPGWVVDIAHNPRIAIDDRAENQCPAYFEGRAKHFVELDPEGNLIRAR